MTKTSFVRSRLVVLVLAVATACVSESEPVSTSNHEHAQHSIIEQLPRQLRAMLQLQDDMRKLWEEHIQWTRQFIVSVAHALPDAGPTAQRLLANQVDIGNVFRRFYGNRVGDELTQLLTEHILIAADLLNAAKAGDAGGVAAASARWDANADQIAALWARINPRSWPLAEMQEHMRHHLALTLEEAVLRLSGDFAGDIAKYEEVHLAILDLADTLSLGIIRQFPLRFL
jgi:hypothetical protein